MGKFTLCIMSWAVLAGVLKGHSLVVLETLVAPLSSEKAILALEKVIKDISPLARGTQVHHGKLREVFDASLQRLKSGSHDKSAAWLYSEGELWFQLWERISYEEGSFRVLVEVMKLRRNLWETLLEKVTLSSQSSTGIAPEIALEIVRWLEIRKPMYPVDRIFLMEAKSRWPHSLMKPAEKITQYLQKKSDLPLAVIIKSVKIQPTIEVKNLELEWSEAQVEIMRSEILQYEKLLRVATAARKTASD